MKKHILIVDDEQTIRELCKELLEEDNYDDAEKCIDSIENIIGNNDREVLALKNSLEFWRE